jgi:S1-C subfamily serine protease
MNFIFGDTAGNRYIGTAGHCVDKVGEDVTIETASGVATTIGTVARRVLDDTSGLDFALVRIDPARTQGMAIEPAVPFWGGPDGINKDPQPGTIVMWWGHGYVVAVEQGKPEVGLVTNAASAPPQFDLVGEGLAGDSGSPVVDSSGDAVGILTEAIGAGGVPLSGLLFGVRISDIMTFLGPGYCLVLADGSGCASASPCPTAAPTASASPSPSQGLPVPLPLSAPIASPPSSGSGSTASATVAATAAPTAGPSSSACPSPASTPVPGPSSSASPSPSASPSGLPIPLPL